MARRCENSPRESSAQGRGTCRPGGVSHRSVSASHHTGRQQCLVDDQGCRHDSRMGLDRRLIILNCGNCWMLARTIWYGTQWRRKGFVAAVMVTAVAIRRDGRCGNFCRGGRQPLHPATWTRHQQHGEQRPEHGSFVGDAETSTRSFFSATDASPLQSEATTRHFGCNPQSLPPVPSDGILADSKRCVIASSRTSATSSAPGR